MSLENLSRSLARRRWQRDCGEIPQGYHVHHKDGDPWNNNLPNLELVEGGIHLAHHFYTRQPITYICQQCGKPYETRVSHGQNRFCSNACKSKQRRTDGLDDETRSCPVCGQDYVTSRYSKAQTCSRVCGGKLSSATKQRAIRP